MTAPQELAARLEWAEAGAFLSMYDAAEKADSPVGAHSQLVAGVAVTTLDLVDSAFFNRALGLATVRPPSAADVHAISETFRQLGRSQSLIQIPDEVTTPDLAQWLGEEGYRRGRRWVKLYHELGDIPDLSTDLRVEEIGPEHGEVFAAIATEAMGFPPVLLPLARHFIGQPGWRAYAAFDGDTPVSTAALFLDGDLAWCGFGATAERARGRGGQSALFVRRLRDARAMGATIAVTETGEETEESPVNHSYRNMLRSGFTLAYARPNWVRIEG